VLLGRPRQDSNLRRTV